MWISTLRRKQAQTRPLLLAIVRRFLCRLLRRLLPLACLLRTGSAVASCDRLRRLSCIRFNCLKKLVFATHLSCYVIIQGKIICPSSASLHRLTHTLFSSSSYRRSAGCRNENFLLQHPTPLTFSTIFIASSSSVASCLLMLLGFQYTTRSQEANVASARKKRRHNKRPQAVATSNMRRMQLATCHRHANWPHGKKGS